MFVRHVFPYAALTQFCTTFKLPLHLLCDKSVANRAKAKSSAAPKKPIRLGLRLAQETYCEQAANIGLTIIPRAFVTEKFLPPFRQRAVANVTTPSFRCQYCVLLRLGAFFTRHMLLDLIGFGFIFLWVLDF